MMSTSRETVEEEQDFIHDLFTPSPAQAYASSEYPGRSSIPLGDAEESILKQRIAELESELESARVDAVRKDAAQSNLRAESEYHKKMLDAARNERDKASLAVLVTQEKVLRLEKGENVRSKTALSNVETALAIAQEDIAHITKENTLLIAERLAGDQEREQLQHALQECEDKYQQCAVKLDDAEYRWPREVTSCNHEWSKKNRPTAKSRHRKGCRNSKEGSRAGGNYSQTTASRCGGNEAKPCRCGERD